MSRRALNIRGALVAKLTAAVDNYAAEIGARMTRLFEPLLLEGETVPDLALSLKLLGRLIRSRFETFMSFYRTQLDESAKTIGPREDIEELGTALRAKMVEYRLLARAAFGRKRSAEIIPIDGATPATPTELYHHGTHAIQRLAEPAATSPPVTVSGVTVDPSQWIAVLSPLVEALGVALGLVERKRGQISGNVADKEQAKKDLDFVYSHGKNLLRALFFLAGMESRGKSLPALRRQRRSRRGGPDAQPQQPRVPEPGEPAPPDAEPPPDTEPEEAEPDSEPDGESSA
ncbi:MAG TPA: hypothetical protein VGG06_07645 [Thermoanaerobaculia bacterium]|jgi:hypothetical protein